MKPAKPVLLLIFDGWGANDDPHGNAIAAANTPVWDNLLQNYPNTSLTCCGDVVGLPDGQIGNSEVGHLTLGAGRVIYQDLSLINQAIENQSFFKHPTLESTFTQAQNSGQAVHIMGLLSDGGVHSHINHILALIKYSRTFDVPVYIHAFLDGRDTPPKSAAKSIQILENLLKSCPNVTLATVCGRFYAMDRDNRWERIEAAYNNITHAQAEYFAHSGTEALKAAYDRDETDEFVQPTLVDQSYLGLSEDDIVIFMNFRADRARQICYALTQQDFDHFSRATTLPIQNLITLTEYDKNLKSKILFPKTIPHNGLGEFIQNNGLKQLRIAETEKYAHVTFFFNGGQEKPFENEDRILIPSPKVKTYDLKPEMSAIELTDKLTHAIASNTYDMIICNYANADMVGHTGNFQATIQAINCLDKSLGKIIEALDSVGGEMLITADHGNADCMFEPGTEKPHTAHTLAKVPLVYYGKRPFTFSNEQGSLEDIAPTLLNLLGYEAPEEMTGKVLLTQ